MPYAYLELSLSGSLTASEQGSLTTTGEFLNVSALDPLLPTFLIATLCLCALSVITYYSLAVAWEVFWASRRSPSPLDPSAEVVLTMPYAYLELSLSGSFTVSDQGPLTTIGELFNISTLDPLLPTFLIATLCLCALLVITYYSLALLKLMCQPVM